MQNAILNTRNEIIGYTDVDSREIEIAGAVALGGAPVNRRTYRVSKSKANRAKLCVEMPVAVSHEHNGVVFYTLEGMEGCDDELGLR
jgi:hypothetical protein